jgi:hypothetical protein
VIVTLFFDRANPILLSLMKRRRERLQDYSALAVGSFPRGQKPGWPYSRGARIQTGHHNSHRAKILTTPSYSNEWARVETMAMSCLHARGVPRGEWSGSALQAQKPLPAGRPTPNRTHLRLPFPAQVGQSEIPVKAERCNEARVRLVRKRIICLHFKGQETCGRRHGTNLAER